MENVTSIATELYDMLSSGGDEAHETTVTSIQTVESTPVHKETSNEIPLIDINKYKAGYMDRQKGAEWFKPISEERVTIIGAGGIGSYLALFVAKLDPKSILIYDPDIIEVHNVTGQLLYMPDSNSAMTLSKVFNVKDTCIKYAKYHKVDCIRSKATKASRIEPITLLGLDSMASRKEMFLTWEMTYKSNPNAVFIDGRLNAEEFQVFTIVGGDTEAIEKYKEHYLFDDSEGDSLACTYKQTSFCASMCASMMVGNLVSAVANANTDVPYRTVPFKIEFSNITKQVKYE